MKKTGSLLISLLMLVFCGHAQHHKIYKEVNSAKTRLIPSTSSELFYSPTTSVRQNSFVANSSAVEFSVNKTELVRLSQKQIPFLNLSVPSSNGNAFELELIPINIYGPQFKVVNAANQEVPFTKATHYKGVVKGDPNSLVAISISDREISGFISNQDGTYVLGKLKKSEKHVLYNDKDLLQKHAYKCGFSEESIRQVAESNSCSVPPVRDSSEACNPVQIYLEADYQIYKEQDSSMVTATDFVTRLFAQVVVLYDRELITVQVSELKIWDTDEPFMTPWTATFQQVYHAFGMYLNDNLNGNFNGHIAHLLSARPLGGGMGGIDVLCSKGWSVTTEVGNTVVELPTYSRPVKVIAHELGHNMGSSHTNSCKWPCGALDNCWTIEQVPGQPWCSLSPFPEVRGTIMSYCDIAGSINLYNGFGILPGNLIRKRVQACMGNTKPVINLKAINIYRNTAHLLWEHLVGEGDYTVEYKPASSNTWTSKTTTEEGLMITGLLANTVYDWRVKVDCSVFTMATFTTNNQPPVEYCKVNYTYPCESWQIKIQTVSFNNTFFTLMSGCPPPGGQMLYFKPIRNFVKGQTQNFTIYPGHGGQPYVNVSIWIDFNKNGIFETPDRVFMTTDSVEGGQISGSFIIPDTAVTQPYTRMRIIITREEEASTSCGPYQAGETEDYLISIVGNCQQTLTLNHPFNDIMAGGQTIQTLSIGGSINAANQIYGTGTTATYQSATINLSPGFKAEKGTIFKAETGGCNN
ncbi:GEVED domain-containing protein [Emticicia agri]|uniref:Peptidase M12B domain-containing protein n=1 Tax=Emticicia agri TaxID=2492393 RepID=A0A4Q5M4W7_9BACT|nr:GEVED domain-containing protein [Emticicia agri]RYU97444.1 hypothetical protein EWM59_01785 [Emticicia agri]